MPGCLLRASDAEFVHNNFAHCTFCGATYRRHRVGNAPKLATKLC
jgi:hypothetical protein